MTRVAVVTGGNKGIGFAIVKQLCKQFDGVVYLTARDVDRGLKAIKQLEEQGLKPKFHQLDITDDNSISTFYNYLEQKYKGLDILVNNAAIAFKMDAKEPFSIQAAETLKINYFGLRKVCSKLYPLLKPHARVVHVSSSSGHLSLIPSETLRNRFLNPNLTEEELDNIMHEFVDAAKTNTHLEKGWANSAYVVSKVGVSALARVHQKIFDSDSRQDLVVNAVHPGYVATDMTSHRGTLTPDQGAEAPVFCALLPENTNIKGKYIWYDKSLVDWTKAEI
ncbi:carbonyl reductase [NADPH] 1-like [Apis mellifera carnica]|uniref:carbonyl reductase (NADPH) n=1 Tax=Apis mellifera TaxID=7460 RepID=A0A7M7GWA9_APIME|nr:carbonyl reductase [NADPH] 1-like [Apis mellifera]KAG9430577.1 carbonyl reductase [NADPH] 1-like [Apis mellifera carnica]|eukprot:XP_006564533.2 carbonyl reductase [NADPH] 1-like [Apis mellifera]